jgi:signal peptidase I
MTLVLRLVRIAVIAAIATVVGAVLAGTLPALLGGESYVVDTAIMQPALQVGDLAVITPARVDQLVAGDVIIYRAPDDSHAVLTRRVLHSEADGTGSGIYKLQVRGDSEATSEQIVAPGSSRLGHLQVSLPRIGLIVGFANSLFGKVLLLGVPLAVFALDYVRKRRATYSPRATEVGAKRHAAAAEVDVRRAPLLPEATAQPAASAKREVDARRVAALLDSGQRALAAGYAHLALRAAEGALVLEPTSAAAALLKRIAQTQLDSQRAHVVV